MYFLSNCSLLALLTSSPYNVANSFRNLLEGDDLSGLHMGNGK